MIVLVDYANVHRASRERGLFYVVLKILETIGCNEFSANETVHFRLYGGWYEFGTFTRQAQQLSVEIQQLFPAPLQLWESNKRVRLRANVELATGLLIDPARELPNTFRARSAPENLRCSSPPVEGCGSPGNCALWATARLIEDGYCPGHDCTIPSISVLSRGEQKLVDTMLVCDLVYLASRKQAECLAIVSTDDDMWPGIRSALALGSRVVHIHPVLGRSTPRFYKDGVGANYVDRSFAQL